MLSFHLLVYFFGIWIYQYRALGTFPISSIVLKFSFPVPFLGADL